MLVQQVLNAEVQAPYRQLDAPHQIDRGEAVDLERASVLERKHMRCLQAQRHGVGAPLHIG
ncbi:hypothetical protein D3C72_2047410 [compost metagenome]